MNLYLLPLGIKCFARKKRIISCSFVCFLMMHMQSANEQKQKTALPYILYVNVVPVFEITMFTVWPRAREPAQMRRPSLCLGLSFSASQGKFVCTFGPRVFLSRQHRPVTMNYVGGHNTQPQPGDTVTVEATGTHRHLNKQRHACLQFDMVVKRF